MPALIVSAEGLCLRTYNDIFCFVSMLKYVVKELGSIFCYNFVIFSFFLYCSDLMGQQPMMIPPPMPGGAMPSYGRGGPTPYGGPVVPPSHMVGGARVGGVDVGFNGYDEIGRGGGGRGFAGGGGFADRGRGGGGRGFGGRGFGGDGRGRGFSGRGFDLGRGGGRSGASACYGGGPGGGRGWRGGRPGGDDLDNIALPKPDFRGLIPFKKDFYVESPSVRAMTEQEILIYRARREITVEGRDVPKPIRMFQEANFPGISLCFFFFIVTYDFSCKNACGCGPKGSTILYGLDNISSLVQLHCPFRMLTCSCSSS